MTNEQSIGDDYKLPVSPMREDHPAFVADASRLATDPWLAERVAFHIELSDPWHYAVAAGMVNRLGEVPRAPHGSSAHDLLVLASDSEPHRWVAGLDQGQRETLVLRGIARVDGIWGQLEGLEGKDELPLDDPDWQADFVDLCRERDMVEGVITLLRWVDPAEKRFQICLDSFDRVAEKFVRSIPKTPTIPDLEDEQLRRATLVSPESWWTSIVAW